MTHQNIRVLLFQVQQRPVAAQQTHQQPTEGNVHRHLVVAQVLVELVNSTVHHVVVVVGEQALVALGGSPRPVQRHRQQLVAQQRRQRDGERVVGLDGEQLAVDVQRDLDVLQRQQRPRDSRNPGVTARVDGLDDEHVFKEDPRHGFGGGGGRGKRVCGCGEAFAMGGLEKLRLQRVRLFRWVPASIILPTVASDGSAVKREHFTSESTVVFVR